MPQTKLPTYLSPLLQSSSPGPCRSPLGLKSPIYTVSPAVALLGCCWAALGWPSLSDSSLPSPTEAIAAAAKRFPVSSAVSAVVFRHFKHWPRSTSPGVLRGFRTSVLFNKPFFLILKSCVPQFGHFPTLYRSSRRSWISFPGPGGVDILFTFVGLFGSRRSTSFALLCFDSIMLKCNSYLQARQFVWTIDSSTYYGSRRVITKEATL